MGLHRAFPHAEIVGVDIRPQPRYPFTFVQGDALEFDLAGFDFVWASPPCQLYTQVSAKDRHRGSGRANSHPDLIGPIRDRLINWDGPYVIENVVGAARRLRSTVLLHGGMFGLGVHRPRIFETSFLVLTAKSRRAVGHIGVYGKLDGRRVWSSTTSEVRAAKTLAEAQQAMGIDWMEWEELREAIPPAYSEYLAQFIPLTALEAA